MPGTGTMRIHLGSLGCKLNQSEMDTLAARLAEVGHQIVTSPAEADLCILNTCAVTHVAAQKSRQTLRRLHRENPQARLVATGCYAELTPGEVSILPGVELVAGNQDKDRLADLIEGTRRASPSPSEDLVIRPPRRRTRALVKIQDGCDNVCTYCTIRVARGPQRSRRANRIVDEIRALTAAGYKEVVLTGVHIGAYGRDMTSDTPDGKSRWDHDVDLWNLIGRVLRETEVPRLRLSSIEPWDLSEQAFALWENARLCRHLHLPLQSGCNATLHRMARHYTTSTFAALVQAARAAIADLAVTTDVIVGFPGETDQEFAESLAFVQAMQFSRVHVFRFSPRPGTVASRMPDQVPERVKGERSRSLRALAARCQREFHERFIGRRMDVLWESCRHAKVGQVWHGLTGNYLRVHAVSALELRDIVTPTRLIAWSEGGLEGAIEDQD